MIWDAAEETPIGVDDTAAAKDAVEAKLDGSFFRVRAERTTELELRYLRAMPNSVLSRSRHATWRS